MQIQAVIVSFVEQCHDVSQNSRICRRGEAEPQ
jgi:hypothetical protein